MTTINDVFIFLLGICFGSFGNVLIYRIPLNKSIIKPRSYCPHCLRSIRWYDNIPLISYVMLCGRCRHCRERISLRYMLVELLTGLLFVCVYHQFKSEGLNAFLYVLFSYLLVIISCIDIDHKIIPDIFSFGMIAVGLAFSPFNLFLGGSMIANVINAFAGGIVGSMFLLAVGAITEKILHKETMGGGDIKLIAGIGVFLGWHAVIYTIFIASIVGSVCGLSCIVLKIITKEDPIPFGPFLSLGALITLFFFPYIKRYLPFN